ncbi:MAG: DUF4830 domain-containing protein [Eubacteriales bacterium]|nr:DUF4830 domain-containing protein [Eubacteriales bacterium]
MKLISCFKLGKNEEKPKRKIRLVLVICGLFASVAVIFTVLLYSYIPDTAKVGDFSYSLCASDEEDPGDFFMQFGFDARKISQRQITVPEGGENFEKYNEIQVSEGLDLRSFSGLEATEYTYKLSTAKGNYLYSVLLVYRGRVIALHFSDFGESGEILSLFDVISK